MRDHRAMIAALMLLGAASSCLAASVKERNHASDKPLYAFVVLDEAATKVLKVVFDESQGTGKGYDTVYADLNFNGDLTDDEPIKGTPKRQADIKRTDCSFPAVDLDVPYNDKAKGIEKPLQLGFGYFIYDPPDRFENRRFDLQMRMKLKDGSGEWRYMARPRLSPVEKPIGVVAVRLEAEPSLILEVKPDEEKPGNTGISASVRADFDRVMCLKGDQPVKARVEVSDERGKAVHSEEVSLEKLAFG